MTSRTAKLFASTAIYLVPIGVMAADLPVRTVPVAPMMTVAPFSWTGFYVGLQAGWQGFQYDYTLSTPFNLIGKNSANSSGFVGGAHVGYNYQINSLVLGLEADIEYAGGGKNVSPGYSAFFIPAGENGLDWGPQVQGSIRARLGFAVDRALFYATGGVAFLRTSTTYYNNVYINSSLPYSYKSSETMAGWTIGAGVEYALSNSWSARLEYRYTDFGDSSKIPAIGSGRLSYKNDLTSNAVRVGVSYRFGAASSMPVVARY